METIKTGKYVEFGYDLYRLNADGTETLVHQIDVNDPEKIVFGVTTGVIVPLEQALEGLAVGGKFDIVVKSDDAFGPYDPEQIVALPRHIFEIDGKFDKSVIKKGAELPMMTADGFRINGKVTEVTDAEVKMDFNHPLAGKDVRLKGEVFGVREATEEDLTPACGCGGCGGGCGDSCGDGCGDNGGCCGCN